MIALRGANVLWPVFYQREFVRVRLHACRVLVRVPAFA